MPAVETAANVHAAVTQRFHLHTHQRNIETLGAFTPTDADVFLAHQVRFLAQAIRELNERIDRQLGA